MSLILTGSRDHALLAMVIQEARRAADSKGGYVGRTAVQKIMYFLKAVGVPMNYQFDIYHYGPYCDDIARDIEWLMADEVVMDRSEQTSKYSNYAPAPCLPELISRHKKAIEPLREHVAQVVSALVPLNPQRLELLATLDYLYRYKKASGGNGPWKDAVIARFLQVKGEKFSRDEVSRTYDTMAQVGLLEP